MKIGFIGTGNMAQAMIGGILKKQVCTKEDIIASDCMEASCVKNHERFGIETTTENTQVAEKADILVLSVKPQYYESVIAQIKDTLRDEQLIITIAPGKTLAWLREQFGRDVKIIRTMPNTPALVGEGMTAACPNEFVEKADLEKALAVLNSFSKTEVVAESLMDVVVSVSGSSPAYIFMLIEAMADGAVSDGMPRSQAYEFAAQAVLGSAKMVLETGKHPGELKDMVCSPGGTTIEAVRVLEERGFRSAIIEAMKSCVEKSRNM